MLIYEPTSDPAESKNRSESPHFRRTSTTMSTSPDNQMSNDHRLSCSNNTPLSKSLPSASTPLNMDSHDIDYDDVLLSSSKKNSKRMALMNGSPRDVRALADNCRANLTQLRLKSEQKLKHLKEKVRAEREKHEREQIELKYGPDHGKSKEVCGGWVLNEKQMEYIRRTPYLYNASAGSYMELFCLQRFWYWLARWIPDWVAPCVITCLGLAINIITCLTVLYYSTDCREEAPAWTFVACAIGVFLYQTLDALDGKQACKVQDTQIEEVYDHGCDAVSTIFVTLAGAVAVQLGRHPTMQFLCFLAPMVAFFSTHWLCHIRHQMVFGKIDVSEGQWSMILIHLLTAKYGQRLWRTKVFSFGPWFDLELVHILALMTLTTLMRAVVDNIKMAMGYKPTPLDQLGIRLPTKKGPTIWYPLYSLAVLIVLSTLAFVSGYFMVSPTIFVLTYGFAFAKLTYKLVMMNVSNGNVEKWDSSLIAPLMIALNTMVPAMRPSVALTSGLVFSIMDFARYFTYSSWDLRVALDLNIFTLKYPAGHPNCKNQNYGFYINGLNNEQILKDPFKNIPEGYDSGVVIVEPAAKPFAKSLATELAISTDSEMHSGDQHRD